MAITVNIVTNNGFDLRWATLYNLFANSTVQSGGTPTELVAVNTGAFNGQDADIKLVVEGSGFTYSGTFPDIALTGGTINGVTIQTEAGVTLATFAGFTIDALAFVAALDTYTAGGPGNEDPSALDAIFRVLDYNGTGGGGSDIFEGGNLADSLAGGGGNDILIGGSGGDIFNGNGGNLDRVSYITSTSGLTADLLTPANNTGDAEGDTYTFVEGIEGSAFDDDLRGNDINNFLIGGAGADILNGRGGQDSASYLTAAVGVTASLTNPAINTGDAAGDSYISIENLSGSNLGDTLIGDANNNFLNGRGGADALDGGAGFDTADYFLSPIGLIVDLGTPANNTGEAVGDTYASIENLRGTAFADTLRGDGNSNLLDGHAGGDILDGAGGFDYAWYNTNSTGAGTSTGVTASLANPLINTGDAAGDTYISIEGLVGSSVADILIGDSGDNFLRGQGGADALDGGAGADYADYINSPIGITVDLGNSLNNTGEAIGDTYTSIENVRGSAFDDTLRGDQFNNTLRGGGGADTLDGAAGFDFASYSNSGVGLTASLANAGDNTGEAVGDIYISIEALRGGDFADTLIGDSGGNFLQGGPGGDTLIGGGGLDYADYNNATSGLTVDLGNSANNTGEAVGDSYSSIEAIRGSGFDDILRSSNALSISELRGGLGADQLVGGSGFDYASYRGSSAGLTVSLANAGANTGEAAGDSYISINGLIGSDFADNLTGNSGGNWLVGRLGGDTLDGLGGIDVASYHQASSAVVASLANSASNVGEAAGDIYISIEGLGGSSFDDTLTGDGGDNRLIGQEGADVLDGGGGSDSAEYINASTGVTVDLANSSNNTSEALGDTYISIENLVGSSFDDLLVGDDNANLLTGLGGDDTLSGGEDSDTAIYRGNRADYSASGPLTNFTITDGVLGRDGSDTVLNVEFVTFADGTFSVDDLLNTSGGAPHDFNGDGKSDILLQNTGNGGVYLWEMDGTSLVGNGFAGAAPGAEWQVKGTGDFNGDGKSDILFQNANTTDVALWEMDDTSIIGSGFVGWQPGPDWQVNGSGDFNGDGKDDVLLQNSGNGSVYLWELDGTSLVGNGFAGPAPGAEWQVKGTGDFNGDGKDDILFQNATTSDVALWEMDSTNIIGSGFVGWQPGLDWQVEGTGDFNGDGKDDVLLQNAATSDVYIWELDGTSLIGNGFAGPTPGLDWQVNGTGDFNGDGKSDILFQNAASTDVVLWEMDGTTIIGSGFVGWTPGPDWLVQL